MCSSQLVWSEDVSYWKYLTHHDVSDRLKCHCFQKNPACFLYVKQNRVDVETIQSRSATVIILQVCRHAQTLLLVMFKHSLERHFFLSFHCRPNFFCFGRAKQLQTAGMFMMDYGGDFQKCLTFDSKVAHFKTFNHILHYV